MSFNRLDDYRSSYNGSEAAKHRGRSFFRRGMGGSSATTESPLLRRKQLSLNAADDPGVCLSGPSSLASSRESSVDRGGGMQYPQLPPGSGFHALVERVRSSPKLGFRRLQVNRSGSFNDVGGGAKASMEAKRRRWLLGRSESLRARVTDPIGSDSPWSSPELDRRGSLPPDYPGLSYHHNFDSPMRERSLDRVQRLERRGSLRPEGDVVVGGGKVKGFVQRWFRHISEASSAYKSGRGRPTSAGAGNGPVMGVGAAGAAASQAGAGADAAAANQNGPQGGAAANERPGFSSEGASPGGSVPEVAAGAEGVDREATQSPTGSNSPYSATSSPSKTKGGTLRQVEIFKIAEPCPLIDPSQVVITKGEIFMADPVLTPIEKLRRKDIEVARALEEKQRLIAEILNVPVDDFDHIVDMASQPAPDRDAKEVLLAALAQAKCLSDLVNESLSLNEESRIVFSSSSATMQPPVIDAAALKAAEAAEAAIQADEAASSEAAAAEAPNYENLELALESEAATATDATSLQQQQPKQHSQRRLPGPPVEKLISISSNMNSHLSTLLAIITERDKERDRLRAELQSSNETIKTFLSQSGGAASSSVRTSSMSATSPASRPASFISVEDSELSESAATATASSLTAALKGNHQQEESEEDANLTTPQQDPSSSSSLNQTSENASSSETAAAAASSEPTASSSSPSANDSEQNFTESTTKEVSESGDVDVVPSEVPKEVLEVRASSSAAVEQEQL